MVNQIAICVKVDVGLANDLEKEISLGWQKRNRLINEAIRCYLDLKDKQRLLRCTTNQEWQREIATEFVRRWLPQALAL